jgi:cytidylate kinase
MTVIAMTREIGSLGMDVAAGVADRLSLAIIDSEIVADNVAQRLGVEAGALLRCVDGSASMLERWLINRRKLSLYTTEEILRLAQRGNVLIRGWGAATLFCDMPQVISVRVCAPMNFRVNVIMKRLGITDAEAVREQIQRYDAAHAHAMRTSFGAMQQDALLYDIILNTEQLSVDACVQAVCRLAEGRRFQYPSTIRSTLSDELLEDKVNSALEDHVSLAVAPTGVIASASSGRVTLAGVTSSRSLRAYAER